jgi:KDO2-lipid IV(A) lauroyltransferase
VVDSTKSNGNKLSLGQNLVLLGIYTGLGFLSLFPLSWVRSVGAAVGNLYYTFANKRVHIVRVNLSICYPDLEQAEREALVKQTFRAAGMWFFEAGAIWFWPTKKLLSLVNIANLELFKQALAQGNGVLLAIPHLGNWELMGPFTTRHSEFTCFYQHESKGQALNEFVRRRRSRNGTLMAPANTAGIRRLYKHLRAGKVAGLLPDHFPNEDMGVFAPLFGKPALTGTLISDLARKNNAPVIAAAMIRTNAGFTLHFVEVENQHCDNAVEAATGLNRAIEKCIALAPGQFQWVYPRFRRRMDPENQPDPYRSSLS